MTEHLNLIPYAFCVIWAVVILFRGHRPGPTLCGAIILALIAWFFNWIGMPWFGTSAIVVVFGLVFWLAAEGDFSN